MAPTGKKRSISQMSSVMIILLTVLTCQNRLILKAEDTKSQDYEELKSPKVDADDLAGVYSAVYTANSCDGTKAGQTTISGMRSGLDESTCSSKKAKASSSSTDGTLKDPRVEELKKRILKAHEVFKSTELPINDAASGSVCSVYTKQLMADLKPFSEGITRPMAEAARDKGILYQILDGQLYREKECRFPSRCSGVQHFLTRIAKDLPDMEFFINVSDWPQAPKKWHEVYPIFSFSKNDEYMDIMYPAWTFWEGGPAISLYPQGIGRWDNMRKLLLEKGKKTPWNEKKSLGFFRGSRTSNERDPLVLLSRKYPELVDAMYTKNQAWKSEKDTLNAPPAAEVSLESHCSYKYLFNYRGVAASFRYKHLFLCRSLVFQVGNEWQEFFYSSLHPWVHYVPVDKNSNEEDIKFILDFFKQNDDLAEAIADAGYNFIKLKLKLRDVQCYWKELLIRYSKLIKYNVKPKKNMLLISRGK